MFEKNCKIQNVKKEEKNEKGAKERTKFRNFQNKKTLILVDIQKGKRVNRPVSKD